MKRKKIKRYILFIVFLSILVIIPITLSKYSESFNRIITLNVRKPEYTVVYNQLLPNEYQEVEYIENSGTQWIDTGIIPSNTLKTDIIYMDTSATSSNYVVGSRVEGTSSNTAEIIYAIGGNDSQNDINLIFLSKTTGTGSSKETMFSERTKNVKYHFNLNIEYDKEYGYRMLGHMDVLANGTSVDGYSLYKANGIAQTYPSIGVFGFNSSFIHDGMRLYSLTFWDGENLVGNFVPCYRISDGEIGLYDMVKQEFHANDGSGTFAKGTDVTNGYHQAQNQKFVYGTAQNLIANTYKKEDYAFIAWNTETDGSGISYIDEEPVNKLTSVDGDEINLYAQWMEVVAEIDGTYYSTLQSAVDSVPTNNPETTIKLLRDTSESITVNANQNIIFDFQDYTLSNNSEDPVIINNGTITISNGTILTTSDGAAAIDNVLGGKLTIKGGNILATGTKQALYNDNGIVEITGNAYLSSVTTIRATVQNLASGQLIITGGTIVSSNQQAINNAGIMTIGIEDGNSDVTTPMIQGAIYGILSTSDFEFYDGIIKGKTAAIYNETRLVGKETEYEIIHSTEIIEGETYQITYLAMTNTVTFNANTGTVNESTRIVEFGKSIGTLPIPTKVGFDFTGWYTALEGGEKITEETTITEDIEYYAHWIEKITAEINGTQYNTLQSAIDSVPTNNTETTIKLLRDTSESIGVKANQNIIFDLQDYTLSNNNTNSVITNNGTVLISNGTILTTSASAAAINNNSSGKLTISGGSILATGNRQAIYNNGGIVKITGTAYLSSTTTERATVQNLAAGQLIITGGTIVSSNQQAVSNTGTLAVMTIGIEDGNSDGTTPVLQGATYGVTSTSDFKFYDGIIKGKIAAIDDETKLVGTETGYEIVYGTEIIEGETYQMMYLTISTE